MAEAQDAYLDALKGHIERIASAYSGSPELRIRHVVAEAIEAYAQVAVDFDRSFDATTLGYDGGDAAREMARFIRDVLDTLGKADRG